MSYYRTDEEKDMSRELMHYIQSKTRRNADYCADVLGVSRSTIYRRLGWAESGDLEVLGQALGLDLKQKRDEIRAQQGKDVYKASEPTANYNRLVDVYEGRVQDLKQYTQTLEKQVEELRAENARLRHQLEALNQPNHDQKNDQKTND